MSHECPRRPNSVDALQDKCATKNKSNELNASSPFTDAVHGDCPADIGDTRNSCWTSPSLLGDKFPVGFGAAEQHPDDVGFHKTFPLTHL